MEGLALRSRRRIIERPRLLRALDRSSSNLRTIVASAGYGKTTLAEQWAAVDGRSVGWYRARTSASDVSVVARGFVEAASAIVPDAGRRLLERLAVTSDPDRDAAVLAEMLATDLAEWPRDGWIVVDDYQFVQAAPDPETFVETLVANAPVQLLLVGRNRPRWVTGRDVLYGDVLEIGRAALAMTADEIDEMLGARAGDLSAGLLALADGWPAVVALSTATSHAELPPGTDVPEELFDFFAEEVFRGLDTATQAGLAALVDLPIIDSEIVVALLGPSAGGVLEEAVDHGLVTSRQGLYELHPLATSFIRRTRRLRSSSSKRQRQIDRVFDLYVTRRDWDAAFELARTLDPQRLIPRLLDLGVPTLASSGRLSTLEHWVSEAAGLGLRSTALRLAEAELAIRQGRPTTALTLLHETSDGLRTDDALSFSVETTKARALHVAGREEEALECFDQAAALATNRGEHRIALEGRLSCAAALELSVAHEILAELEATVDRGSALEVVRVADRVLSLGLRFGRNRRREVPGVSELLDRTDDPFARMSFLCLWGWCNVLSSRYQTALAVADRALDDLVRYRVEVGSPYVRIVRAAAFSGLGLHAEALTEVDAALDAAESMSDLPGIQNGYALKMRILVASGFAYRACGLEPPDMEGAMPFVVGEVYGSRALAMVSAGRLQEAEDLAVAARAASQGVETRVLVAVVNALQVLRTRTSSTADALERMVDEAFNADAPDLVVCAYRANPELLAALFDHERTRDRARYMVDRANDQALVDALGIDSRVPRTPQERLSKREVEVFDLICEGLSNSEIGKRLFIAESTVKAHVHRIFDKLEIRSRSALAIDAARRRYAASTDTAASESST